jgi:uncharacterized protein (DUF924 family)
MASATDVIDYWLNDVGQDGWYSTDPKVDDEIRKRFLPLWQKAEAGGLQDWLATREGTLAYLIVTDQFSRNMFRGDGRAFATDGLARAAARDAIARNHDLDTAEPERVFFYMPFEHSEHIADQDWSVALMTQRLPKTGAGFGLHARAHREIILRFGRFPFRNAALGRDSSPAEQDFLDNGGYGALVRKVEAQ